MLPISWSAVILLLSSSCYWRSAGGAKGPRSGAADTAADFLTIADLSPHQHQLFKFFSGGLSEIVWQNVTFGLRADQLSPGCRQELLLIQSEIDRGSEWAFNFPDAGSKSPSGILDGTLTSFGGYDQCLAIDSHDMVGKYCSIQLRHVSGRRGSFEIDDLLSRSVPSFTHVYLNMGLCVPSACSPGDVKSLMKIKLQDFPFEIESGITCDSAETTSWVTKIKSLNASQMIAAAFLAAVVGASLLATLVHTIDSLTRALVNVPAREYVPMPQVVDVLMHFSLANSIQSLVRVKKEDRFVTFPEIMTVILVLGVIYAQAAFLFESMPLGFNVIHRSHDLKKLMTYVSVQPFFSDGFYGILPFIAGFLTLQTCRRAQSFNPLIAILRKYIKLASGVAFVLAMEFLWPIISQGPFYSRVSDQLMEKCSKTWWTHLLMIANLNQFDQTCSPHLTIASIHMQLFPIGLLLSFFLIRLPGAGVRITLTAAIIALLNVYANTSKLHSPVLFDKDLTYSWTMDYINTVLLSFSSHLVNYLFGLLAAFALSRSPPEERVK